MKTIIAGSRGIVRYTDLLIALKEINWIITEVVSGRAKGVDHLGEFFAEDNLIKLTKFPAQWNKFGLGAGMIRNREMAKYAEAALILWDGQSKGTKNMISLANEYGLTTYIHKVED